MRHRAAGPAAAVAPRQADRTDDRPRDKGRGGEPATGRASPASRPRQAAPPPRMTTAFDLDAAGARRRPRRGGGAPAGRATCSPSATSTPTRTRWAPTLAVCRLVEAIGGRATAVCSGRAARRSTTSCRTSTVPDADPDPGRDYDLLVLADCATAERVGARGDPARGAVPRRAEDRHRPSRLERGDRRRGTGSTRTPRRPARWSRCSRRARRPARDRRRGDGDRADGRDRDRHGDVRPSQRHAADARGVGGARRRRRAAVRPVAAVLPLEARRPAPAVRARARSPPGVAGRSRDLVDAARSTTSRRPGRSPRTPRGSSTCSPSRRPPRSRCCSRSSPTARRACRCARSPGGVDATVLTGEFGGGGHTRASGASMALPVDEAVVAAEAVARRLALGRAPMRRPSAAAGSTASSSSRSRRVRPRTTSSGLVRRLSSTRRVGHGGTLDPFAAGVLPVFLGRATRLVEYHLGGDEGLPRDDLLRRAVDDGRHRRPADAGRRAAGHPRGGRGRARRVHRRRSARSRPTTARSRSRAAGRTSSRGRARRWCSRRAT